jgi:hypothetical protein
MEEANGPGFAGDSDGARLGDRVELPVGPLFCIIDGPARGLSWSSGGVRVELRQLAAQAGVRRRVAPHQLRHAHAIELAREGVSDRPQVVEALLLVGAPSGSRALRCAVDQWVIGSHAFRREAEPATPPVASVAGRIAGKGRRPRTA